MIEVRILHVADCPNAAIAVERVNAAAAERGDVTVTVEVIADAVEAEHAGMHGSPTITIDGADPFSPAGTPASLACRFVPGGDPVPAEDALIEVLGRAGSSR